MKNKFYDAVNDQHNRYLEMDEDGMREHFFSIYPGGSGPLSAMSIAAASVLAMAKLRGFDITDWHKRETNSE